MGKDDNVRPNFPSQPPSPMPGRHEVQVHPQPTVQPTRNEVHVEFEPDTKPAHDLEYEPDEKPSAQDYDTNYDTVRSFGSIGTIEENADVPPDVRHRHSRDSGWLELEIKKTNHHLTQKLGHSMHQNCERFSLRATMNSVFPLFGRLQNYSKQDLLTDFIAGNFLSSISLKETKKHY